MNYIFGVLFRILVGVLTFIVIPLELAPYTRDGSYFSGLFGMLFGMLALLSGVVLLLYIVLLILVPNAWKHN